MQKVSFKKDIRLLSLEELKLFLIKNGEKPFRATQIYEWLWKKNVNDFVEMANLPMTLRDLLTTHFRIRYLLVDHVQKSVDGTVKTAFSLDDGGLVEGVLIPTESKATACISSQEGCQFGCRFCATGAMGFRRNLTAGEMYDQVWEMKRQAKDLELLFTNIVYMGMGEPLLNYEQVLSSIEKITSKKGLGMSPRRITVSTVGIPDMIKRLGDDKVRFNLAVSLHAARDDVREQIMPVNRAYPLNELIEAIRYFHDKTGTRVTFEYLLLRDVNDRIQDAEDLAAFCRNFPCKVNVIEYNPVGGNSFQRSKPDRTEKFMKFLESRNMIVNIRRSRGKDINAACGQLVNKHASN